MKIYGERPPYDEAAALVRRRINVQMKHKRPGENLRDRFVLVPILHRNFSTVSGQDYFDRQWGVRVDDTMIGYVRSPQHVLGQAAVPRVRFVTDAISDRRRTDRRRDRRDAREEATMTERSR